MTPKEFVIWLQGFVAATHEYSMTPKQWDHLKEKLQTVDLDASFQLASDAHLVVNPAHYISTTGTYTLPPQKDILKD